MINNEKNEKDDIIASTENSAQGINAFNSTDKGNTLLSTETKPHSYGAPRKEHAVNEKERSLIKMPQKRRAIMAGGAGTKSLVSSVASYAQKMHVTTVIGGIDGLTCMSFALYNMIKLGTKLKEVEGIKRF